MFTSFFLRLMTRVAGSSPGNREIFTHASGAFVLKVVAAITSFCLSVTLARLIGADGAGVYFLAVAVVTVAITLGRLGLDNIIVRYIAGARARGDTAIIAAAHSTAKQLVLLAAGVAAVLVFAAAPVIAQHGFHKPELETSLRIASIAILPTALAHIYAQSLRGLKRIPAAMALISVWIPLFTLAGIIPLTMAFGVAGAAWSFAAASVLCMLIGVVQWRRQFERSPASTAGQVRAGQMITQSTPLLWTELLNGSHRWMPTLFLGIWAPIAEVGIYAVAQRTAFITASVLLAVNSIVGPMFAESHQHKDLKGLERTARYAAKLMSVFALPFVLPFVLIPGIVLSIFGAEFAAGAVALVLLSLGQYVNVVTGSVGNLLIMTGHERVVRNNALGAAIVKVVLSVVLIPRYGMVGAAIAISIGMAGQNIVAAFLVRRYVGIWTLPLPGLAAGGKPEKR